MSGIARVTIIRVSVARKWSKIRSRTSMIGLHQAQAVATSRCTRFIDNQAGLREIRPIARRPAQHQHMRQGGIQRGDQHLFLTATDHPPARCRTGCRSDQGETVPADSRSPAIQVDTGSRVRSSSTTVSARKLTAGKPDRHGSSGAVAFGRKAHPPTNTRPSGIRPAGPRAGSCESSAVPNRARQTEAPAPDRPAPVRRKQLLPPPHQHPSAALVA